MLEGVVDFILHHTNRVKPIFTLGCLVSNIVNWANEADCRTKIRPKLEIRQEEH